MNRLRSVVQVVRRSMGPRRNFFSSASPGLPDGEVMIVVAGLAVRGVSCWIGYNLVDIVGRQTTAEFHEERLEALRGLYGESAEKYADLIPGLGESIRSLWENSREK